MAQYENENQKSNDLGVSAETARKAAATTRDVIKTAKDVAKISAKVASGNWVGAAKDTLLSKEVRTLLLTIIACFLVLVMLVSYAIPSLMFGAVQEFIDEAEEYITYATAETGDTVSDTLMAIPNLISSAIFDFASLIGNILSDFVTSVFSGGGDNGRVETYEETAFLVTQDEDAAIDTLFKQAEKTVARFDTRWEQYNTLCDEIKESFQQDPPPIALGYDYFYVDVDLIAPRVSTDEAIQFMATYSIQRGNGMRDIELRSLLAWIGYFNSLTDKTDKYVVEGRNFYTYDWSGDWIPQYLYEQKITEENNEWELSDYPYDSFLMEVYFIDDITVKYIPSTITEENSDGEVETKTVLTMKITVSVKLLNVNEISDQVMGFWLGDLRLSNAEHNRTVAGVPAIYFAKKWTANGHDFERLAGYQVEYLGDEQLTTRQYMGLLSSGAGGSNIGGLDFTIEGGLNAATEEIADFVEIAMGEVGTTGGSRYWSDLGYGPADWCGYFVMWCAEQAGLADAGDCLSKLSGSVTRTWRNYGGYCDENYRNAVGGSNEYGTSIVVDDTVLYGGSYIPQCGDLIIFANKDNELIHIGIVASYDMATNDLISIEGNTSGSSLSSLGPDYIYETQVMAKHRTTTQRYGTNYKLYNIIGFIHPNYPEANESAADTELESDVFQFEMVA